MNGQSENSKKKEAVRLDETIKLLFEVSKPTLIKTLNSLFDENYEPDNVIIDKTATEYPNNELDIIRADLFISITEYKPKHYHLEIQTEPHNKMAVRAFEYGVMKALSNYRLEDKKDNIPNLRMPKSLIIQIEDGETVPDESYPLILTHENKKMKSDYKFLFPVMRYFDYDEERLIKEKLFILLPLQIFLLRNELDKATKNNDEELRQEAILRAKNLTEKIASDVIRLREAEEINDIDTDKIMIGISECFQHLNNRYRVNEELNTEVQSMVRTFLDTPLYKRTIEAEQRAEKEAEKAKQAKMNNSIEIAINLLDVLDVETIAKKTKLSIEKVKELKAEYLKDK